MTQSSVSELTDLGVSPALTAVHPNRHRVVRWLYIASGSLLVAVGVIGIILPLLPSTIFFLLAAACFGRSSPSAYRWLTTNRWFGKELQEYREERGATPVSKALSIGTLWVGIALSAYFIDSIWIRVLLLAIATGVTIHLVRLNTIRR